MGKQIMSSLQEAERRSNLSKVTGSKNEIATLPTVARNDGKINIDINSLPAGIYFVKVTTNKGTAVRKFVKQ